MVKIKITLPIHYTQDFKTKKDKTILVGMNWFRNAHYLVSNKVKHHYHNLVINSLPKQNFGKIKLDYKVFVGRRNTDGHNVRAVIEKFFLDGLVEGGYIEDDSIDYVVGDTSSYYLDKSNPRIEITIEDIG